jgi:16S rRNA (uracil1498-N3)-methyltransferase
MALFYCPNISNACVLPEEESQHAVKVLRLQAGESIIIIDGKGGYYEAEITLPHQKHCEFRIVKATQNIGKRNYRLHIAIAPTKNIERFEWFIEKATEIGIDEITPLLCRFSERKNIKNERLEKIIISAAKQSKTAYFPVLNPLTPFNQLIKTVKAENRYIAHCYEQNKKHLKSILKGQKEILILIGPEGDFSMDEVETAISEGVIPITFGESRLRTETAGVVACVSVQLCI